MRICFNWLGVMNKWLMKTLVSGLDEPFVNIMKGLMNIASLNGLILYNFVSTASFFVAIHSSILSNNIVAKAMQISFSKKSRRKNYFEDDGQISLNPFQFASEDVH